MKNYRKVQFNRVKHAANYALEKMKAGHVIIRILVNEDEKEIEDLTSYANDRKSESYFVSYLAKSKLEQSVIIENLAPYYAFKDTNRKSNLHTAGIDIQNDSQRACGFDNFEYELEGGFEDEFEDMEEYYNGASFKYEDDGDSMHYEFFISNDQGDISNFGGPMELDFVEQWMVKMGYYSNKES